MQGLQMINPSQDIANKLRKIYPKLAISTIGQKISEISKKWVHYIVIAHPERKVKMTHQWAPAETKGEQKQVIKDLKKGIKGFLEWAKKQ